MVQMGSSNSSYVLGKTTCKEPKKKRKPGIHSSTINQESDFYFSRQILRKKTETTRERNSSDEK